MKGYKSFKGYVKQLLKIHKFDNYGDLIEHITNGDEGLFSTDKAKQDFNLYCDDYNYNDSEILKQVGIFKLIRKYFHWSK